MMFQKDEETLVSQAESDVGADEAEASDEDEEADVDVDNLRSSVSPPACSFESPQLFSHGTAAGVVKSAVICGGVRDKNKILKGRQKLYCCLE